MGASLADHDEEGPSLTRTCHVCGDEVDSDVWYARTEGHDEGPRRVYACPNCYFDLTDDERDSYYRERV
jgi:DNA-directed RNA polymerase subunit M/transcription elongation factor TFIIS